jgi:glutamate-1-semialdehyde 2,1-aminomutase
VSITQADTHTAIEEKFRARTPRSAQLMKRAARVMPGGVTRGHGFHLPYPAVMDHGEGCYLWDVDGNRYVDLVSNGLALIHGHAFQPVIQALSERLPRSWGWVCASTAQIEFAETLCDRLDTFDRVLMTNSGTESGMLAVKLARRFTGKPLILKQRAGYHGSYSDLEAGLGGRGELPGHTLLAEFNDLASYERKLIEHKGEVAAILVEPVMFTGVTMLPEKGFLSDLQQLARDHGTLFILDDCLMLRLAYGGSAQKFELTPDLTFLGKFLGGGTPVGAVGGRADILEITNPRRENALYHGGSYNGNLLGSIAGRITLEHLTQEKIDLMDAHMEAIRRALEIKARQLGLPLTVQQIGSIMGVFFTLEPLTAGEDIPHASLAANFHLACANNGVHITREGSFALTTAVDDRALQEVLSGITNALEQVAKCS